MRGAGPVGDFGLCRAAVGTLVDRPVRALAAGRRAVQGPLGEVSRRAGSRAGWRFRSLSGRCRHTRGPPGASPRRRPPGGAKLPCIAAVCHGHLQTYSSKGEAALLLAGLAGQVTTGRVGRPDVSTTPSATLHILSESGRTPLDRGTAVVWSMAARAGPDPMSNAAAKPASHRGRPSCSSAFLLCVRRVSSQLVRPLRGSKSALSVIAISTHRCRHTRGPLFRAVCDFVRAGAFF